MHQLLRLENLSALPLSLRRFALPAARGSWSDLTRLLRLLGEIRDQEAWTRCLPIFYANLDPVYIPTTEIDGNHPAITRALLILGSLRLLKPSHAPAVVDLWPRLWEWLSFLHTYRDYIPSLALLRPVSYDLLSIITTCSMDSDTSELMGRTPGVREVVMHAWSSLVGDNNAEETYIGFLNLGGILSYFMEAEEPANRAEILDATDGPWGLTCLIARYIERFMPLAGTAITEETVYLYEGIVAFILDLTEETGETGTVDIAEALLASVASFTTVICAISRSPLWQDMQDRVVDLLQGSFQVLHHLLLAGSHKAICDAIPAGLLPAIIRSSIICDGDDFECTSLYEVVDIMLPAATVYRSVLLQLEPQLDNVKEIADSPAFQATTMAEIWDYFAEVAQEHIELELAAGATSSQKACDNMECGIIQEKQEFQRCSHCQQVYYCSSECQKRDWRSGHRESCNSLRICRSKNSDISRRDLSFMRALFDSDSYELQNEDRLQERVFLMRDHPGEPIVSVLDYTDGSVRAFITTLAEERAADERGDVCWIEHVSRAARSRGRMELHIMRAWDGTRQRRWMFPQRCNHSRLTDGLARILKGLSSLDFGPEEEDENSRDAAEEPLVRIHC
ncbi:hypothetical protein DFH06DRAFT_575091 [Mycena polygramma]|nr:hypothetical protein DFH06DRAFT_575091 [Mycena polygramma]